MAILSIVGLYGASGGFTTAFGWGLASLISGGLASKDTKTGRLSNLDAQTSDPDQPIPWVFGRHRVAGNIIWSSRLREHKKTTHSGKKGGLLKGPKNTEFWYSEAALICFCKGPITRFDGIKMDAAKKLFWKYNNGAQAPFDFTANSSTGMWTKDNGGGVVMLNGTETHVPLSGIEAVEGDGFVPAYRGRACIYFNDLDLRPYGGRFPVVTAWPVSPITSVADILRMVIAECSVRLRFPIDTSSDVTDDIDVSAVRGDNVSSFIIESIDTAEQRVEELGMLFGFDWVKQGRKLVVVKRGGDVVRSIPIEEMRWHRPTSEMPKRGESIGNRQDLPMAVELGYINTQKQYRDDVTRSPIMTEAISRRVERMTTTASLTPPVARRIAKRICHEIWNRSRQRTEYIDWKHLDLTASDPITIPTPLGGTSDWIIENATGELMGPMEVVLNPHDPYLYGYLDYTAVPVDPDEEDEVNDWAAARLFCADAPGISNAEGDDIEDTLSDPGLWTAVSQTSDFEWNGASMHLEIKDDGDWKHTGDTWEEENKAVMGELTAIFSPQGPEDGYDTGASMQVEVYSGSLHSIPLADCHKGYNLLLLENGIFVSFKDVETMGVSDDGGVLYELSTLKSGRAGSDDFIPLISGGVISPGMRFVLVRTEDGAPGPGVRFRTLPRNLIGRQIQLESVVFPDFADSEDQIVTDRAIDGVDDQLFQAVNMQAYAPTVTVAQRVSGDLTLSGRARSRYVENQALTDSNLWRMSEPQFSGQYKYEVVITSGSTSKSLILYTTDTRGTFNWTITAATIASALGFTPGAGTLEGTVALYGSIGPGRKRSWVEA